MLLPTCGSIQSFAFQENPGEVALKHYTASCVIANYFVDTAVLCIGYIHFLLEHLLRGCLKNNISWSHNRQNRRQVQVV